LIDSPEFPEAWKPVAQGGIVFLDALRQVDDIDWTFFSPAAFIFEGPRLGQFRLGKDDLVTDANGESRISFADYAIALVDELEQGAHIKTRFTAAY
jgi:putative NADH-flavin reductase